MDALDRIKILCIERGTTVSKLERTLGYSNGSINNKNKNGISLSNKRLVEVADYFRTTLHGNTANALIVQFLAL